MSCHSAAIQLKVEEHEQKFAASTRILKKFEDTMINLESNSKSQTNEEAIFASNQIRLKLEELQAVLKKIHDDSSKDDRFTTIMNSIISTM
jgi:DNA transposition AAA+ family ATPase